MQKLILRFIPDVLRQDVDVFRSARLIVATALISTVVAVVYAMQYLFVLNAPVLAALLVGAGVVLAFVPVLMRRTGSLALMGNITAGLYLVVVAALSFFEGGSAAQARFWLCVAPLLATMFNGIRSGARWMVVAGGLLVVSSAASMMGFVFPSIPITSQQRQIQDVLGIVGLVVLIYLLGRQFQVGKSEAFRMLEAVQKASEERARADYHQLEALKAANEARAAEDIRRIEEQRAYLTSSVEQILQTVDKMAQGDMTVSVHVGKGDDIERLSSGLTSSVETVREMLTQIAEAIKATSEAVRYISEVTDQLASAANQESSQIHQTAAAVEEMSRTIAQTTEQVALAAKEAMIASSEAHSGGSALHTLIENVQRVGGVVMDSSEKILRLGSSSEQIGEIVAVIDEIADQTNLLALNAAIEAARAGEQGRGFAVVADEVRKLAERTQQATKQISQVIGMIQSEVSQAVEGMNEGKTLVQDGTQLVARTSLALERIMQRTQTVADVINHVASASEEEAATSAEMAQTMAQMTSTVEDSARGIVEIARSLEGLLHQAQQLRFLMAQFTIQRQQQQPKQLEQSPQRYVQL